MAAGRPIELTAIDSPAAAVAGQDAAAPAPEGGEPRGGRGEAAVPPSPLRLFPDAAGAALLPRREAPRQNEDAAAERSGPPRHDPQPGGNGNPARPVAAAAAAPPSGEPRRTLHLSLSGGDGGHRQGPAPAGGGDRMPQPASATPPAAPALGPVARQGVGQFLPAANVAAMRSAAEVQPSKEGGAFIDHALRERVDGDIAAFLAAFDAALDHDTAESRSGLREATDRLLRAGARTRIELERLEARVPLVSREKSGQEARGFRPR